MDQTFWNSEPHCFTRLVSTPASFRHDAFMALLRARDVHGFAVSLGAHARNTGDAVLATLQGLAQS